MERSRRDVSGAVTTAPSGTGPTLPSALCAGNVHLSQFKTKALKQFPDLDLYLYPRSIAKN